MSELVLVEKVGSKAIVTLNRPASMNALSSGLLKDLASAFRGLALDDDIAAVILTGAGKAFCAGVDLRELTEAGPEGFSVDGEHDIKSAILEFDRPVIGAVNGVAATGGFELALLCDVLIASDRARFADTHALVGVLPGWGMSQRLSRIVGINRARDLSLTGSFLSAEKAEAWGLVSRVVSAEELMPTCEQIADDMAKCDRDTLIGYKRIINDGAGMDLDSGLKYEQLAADMHRLTKSGADVGKLKEKVIGRNQE